MIEFGAEYMAQIVANAQALGAALNGRGIPVLGAHKGFTRTHQVIADVLEFGGGLVAAQKLAEANIITNKNLIPSDRAEGLGSPGWPAHRDDRGDEARNGHSGDRADCRPDGCGPGDGRDPAEVNAQAIDLRSGFQAVRYCFTPARAGPEHGAHDREDHVTEHGTGDVDDHVVDVGRACGHQPLDQLDGDERVRAATGRSATIGPGGRAMGPSRPRGRSRNRLPKRFRIQNSEPRLRQ
jgi:hypothetical protein